MVESCNGYHSCNKMQTVDFPFCFFVTSVLDINSNHVTNMYYKVSGLYLFSCRIFVWILHVLYTCIDLYEYLVPKWLFCWEDKYFPEDIADFIVSL